MGVRPVRTPALAQSLGQSRELGDVYAYKMDPYKQWGPFSAGAGESLSGGGAKPDSHGTPISPLSGYRLSGGAGACLALCIVSQSPWEPEGLSEEGRKCAQG